MRILFRNTEPRSIRYGTVPVGKLRDTVLIPEYTSFVAVCCAVEKKIPEVDVVTVQGYLYLPTN
jgi:hypothetical protein